MSNNVKENNTLIQPELRIQDVTGGCLFILLILTAQLEKSLLKSTRVEKMLDNIVNNPEEKFLAHQVTAEDLTQLLSSHERLTKHLNDDRMQNVREFLAMEDSDTFLIETEEFKNAYDLLASKVQQLIEQKRYGRAIRELYHFVHHYEQTLKISEGYNFVNLKKVGDLYYQFDAEGAFGISSQASIHLVRQTVEKLFSEVYMAAMEDSSLTKESKYYALVQALQHSIDEADRLKFGDPIIFESVLDRVDVLKEKLSAAELGVIFS